MLALLASGRAGGQESRPQPVPVVATHYFYWYRWPTEHFNEPGAPGPEGHLHHLPTPQEVSYADPAWHVAQFRAMVAAGIDVALPVYWGAPGAYERPNLSFSQSGLDAMVKAADTFGRSGERAPQIGLFYDTSTLLGATRGVPAEGRADLTTEAGRALFSGTIVEFFERVPPARWARLDGGALVVLYSAGFAAKWDREVVTFLRKRFAQRFPGERVFLVADASWGDIGQDLTTQWGAALAGPQIHPGCAQIGPGYDDSAVPGRTTPRRDREGGAFYRHSWREAIASHPRLVLIETWNELHEGTEICETKETGRLFLDLTREWITRLKSGADPGPEIPLQFRMARPRPNLTFGADARGATAVSADYTGPTPREAGLRGVPWADGPLRQSPGGLVSDGLPAHPAYVYFQVSDHWRFDVDEDFEFVCTFGAAPGDLLLDYDSHDGRATHEGAYTGVRPEPADQDPLTRRWILRHARLADRQNGGADLRLVTPGAVSIRTATLSPRAAAR